MVTVRTGASGSLLPRAMLGAIPMIVAAAWTAVLNRFGDLRLQRLSVPAYDAAYFQQLAWGIFHGQTFRATFLHGNFLGLHFSPLLVLPAALEVAVPGAQGLNLLSAMALGAVGPACFLACRTILPDTPAGIALAVVLAVAVPFTPPLQEAAWSGFHTEELALPMLFVATWAAVRGRRAIAIGLIVAVLLAKEDQAYQVVALGVLLAVLPGRQRLGTWTVAAALLWGTIVFLLLMPWLRHGGATDTSRYYSWLVAGGVSGTFTAARVSAVAVALAGIAAWRMLALTAFALCLLPLLRPGYALLAVPPLLAASLSQHQPQPLLQLQYGLPIVYPVVMAAALGGRRLLEGRRPRAAWMVAALVPGALVALTGSLLMPLAGLLAHPGPLHLAGLERAMTMVPAAAELDVDDAVAAAVASRAEIHLLPYVTPRAFVVVDIMSRPPLYADTGVRDRAVQELPRGRRRLWTDGRIELWSPVEGNRGAATGLPPKE